MDPNRVVIGVDPHKRSHTLVAVDGTGPQAGGEDDRDGKRSTPRGDALGADALVASSRVVYEPELIAATGVS